ncbi:MAG: hypothetical protein ABSA84_03005 [Gammaproteobacteria bacterium]
MDNNNYYNACGSIIARYGIEVDNVSEQLYAVGIGANNFNRIEELYPHLLEYISLDIEGISSGSESIVRPLTPDGSDFLSAADRDAINRFINSYNQVVRDLNALRIEYIAGELFIEARDVNDNIVRGPNLNQEIASTNQQSVRNHTRPRI